MRKAEPTTDEGSEMIRKKRMTRKGQNILEYAVVVGVVAAAMIAMSTYAFRSVQAAQQMIQEEFSNE